MKKTAQIYIGTSGWHYSHWNGIFYPKEVTGYNELRFFSQHFNTVENNSSFYRISKESTYKTWARMTPPDGFKFSLKLNKLITHVNRLELTEEVRERCEYILTSTQVLEGKKLGAIVIQLPASFKLDLPKLDKFLTFFTTHARALKYPPDIAIEFRNKIWFTKEVYVLLKKHNVALVSAQSSRYPGVTEITADIAYIRLHGPEKLFASEYSQKQLQEWTNFITKAAKKTKRVYVYFNNDFHGYALKNAKELYELLGISYGVE
jgi:uncharacterized protein YecE (DUF72 family)